MAKGKREGPKPGWWKQEEDAPTERKLRYAKKKTPKRRRWLRPVLITAGVLALLLVVLVLLLPTIAAKIAPGYIEAAANKSIKGTVRIQAMDLSWSGPQRIGSAQLLHAGTVIGTLSVSVDRGLIGLALAPLQPGEITIAGDVKVTRDALGRIDLLQAVAPADAPATKGAPAQAPPKKAGPELPAELDLTVALNSVAVTFIDRLGPDELTIKVPKLTTSARIATGKPLKLKLQADVSSQLASGTASTSSIAIDGDIAGWSSASGNLSIAKSSGKLEAKLDHLPSIILDTLAGTGGPSPAQPTAGLPAGPSATGVFGAESSLVLKANGSLNTGTLELALQSPRTTVAAKLAAKDGVVSLSEPLEATMEPEAVMAIGQPSTGDVITRWPRLALQVRQLSGNVDRLRAGDYRGVSLATKLTAKRATINIAARPGGRATAATPPATANTPAAPNSSIGPASSIGIDTFELDLSAADLATGLAIGTTLALDGAQPTTGPAVELAINLGSLLNSAGAIALTPSSAQSGQVTLRQLPTALLTGIASAAGQSIESNGFNVAKHIGPSLSGTINITQIAGSTGGTAQPGGTPPANLRAELRSAQMTIKADVMAQDSGITSPADRSALDLTLASGEALIAILQAQGVDCQMVPASGQNQPVALSISGLSLPRTPTTGGAAAATGGGGIDTASAKFNAKLSLGGLSFAMAPAQPAQANPPGPPGQLNSAGTPPLLIEQLSITCAATPGQLTAEVNTKATLGATSPALTASLRMPGGLATLLAPAPLSSPSAAQPAGLEPLAPLLLSGLDIAVDLNPLPTAVLLATVPNLTPAQRSALTSTIGGLARVTLSMKPASGGAGSGGDLALSIQGEGLTLDAWSRVRREGLTAGVRTLTTRITPALLAAFAADAPPLAATTRITAFLPEATIAWNLDPRSLKVESAGSGQARAEINLDAVALDWTSRWAQLQGIEPVSPLIKSALGLGATQLAVTVPSDAVGAMLAPEGSTAPAAGTPRASKPLPLTATFTTVVRTNASAASADLLQVATTAGATLIGGRPAGPATLTTKLDAPSAPRLLAALPGTSSLEPWLGRAIGCDVAVALAEATSADRATITITPRGDVVTTATPLVMLLAPDRITQEGSFGLSVNVNPRTLTEAAKPSGGGAGLTIEQIAPVQLTLQGVKLGRGATPAMAASVFAAALDISIAQAQLRTPPPATGGTATGSNPAANSPVALSGIRLSAEAGKEPGTVSAVLSIAQATVGPSTVKQSAVTLTGQRLITSDGRFDASGAVVRASGSLPVIPTAMVDSLANQNGLLRGVLGELMAVQITSVRQTATGLELRVLVRSFAEGGEGASDGKSRSELVISGELRGKGFTAGSAEPPRFVGDGAQVVSLAELPDGALASVLKPAVIASLTKPAGSQPATLALDRATIPLSGEMTLLSGDALLKVGNLVVGPGPLLRDVLELPAGKSTLDIGASTGDLTVAMRSGVAQIATWSVTVGGFTPKVSGSVDLVQRRADILLAVPVGLVQSSFLALTAKQLGIPLPPVDAKVLFGNSVDPKDELKIRLSGPLDNLKRDIDPSSFRPIIERAVANHLKGLIPNPSGLPNLPGSPASPSPVAPGPSAPGVPMPAAPTGPSLPGLPGPK